MSAVKFHERVRGPLAQARVVDRMRVRGFGAAAREHLLLAAGKGRFDVARVGGERLGDLGTVMLSVDARVMRAASRPSVRESGGRLVDGGWLVLLDAVYPVTELAGPGVSDAPGPHDGAERVGGRRVRWPSLRCATTRMSRASATPGWVRSVEDGTAVVIAGFVVAAAHRHFVSA